MVVDLPAPFGPEEAEDLARLDGEVEVGQGRRQLAAIPLGESAGLDDGHRPER